MKKLLLLTAAAFIMAAIVSCSQQKEEWKLVWEENFDQDGNFDEAVWSKISRGPAEWRKYMSDYDSLYEVKDGNMILRGMANPGIEGDDSTYITGGIYSKGKKSFSDGRLEIRARLHGAHGAWPALWLMPEDTIGWPHGGEIDIMERLNFDSIAYQTVHSNYTYNLKMKEPQQGATGAINPDDYNVYAVELYHDSLSFYINGKHTFTYPRIETDKEGQFPFGDYEYFLKMDMQLGGSWVGKIDPEDLPVEMEIDWVRFYKKQK